MNNIDTWIMSTSKYFPAERVALIREKLSELPESKVNILYSLQLKDPMMVLIMSILFGIFGVDRFMLGDTGLGIGKLLTLGGCGIWAIIDIFFCHAKAKEINYITVMQLIHQYGK